MLKKQNGITLVALVITIIVLLILAGITLSMVLGPNGIIGRAQEAKNATENAGKNENQQYQNALTFINEQLTTP
ncbi:MAG: type II secretion system protein [Clostridia bacterium]